MNYADVMLDMNNTGEAILYRTELDRLGKTYEFHMYEGAQHGFNNDTNEPRYNQAAAELAWGRTIDWFKQYLS
jgi:carboxymethylenebutenolidase